MIRSDPAECAMESRIAHEWDILGTIISILLSNRLSDYIHVPIVICLSNFFHPHLSLRPPIYNLPIHPSVCISVFQSVHIHAHCLNVV